MVTVRRRGPTATGCVLSLLAILIVVVLIVGWWRNWYNVATQNAEQDVQIGVQIHKDEVGRDLGRLKEETKRLTESAQAAAELSTLEGVVTDLSPTQMTVRVAEQEHPVMIDQVTQYYVGDNRATLEDVQQGHEVLVTFQETDGRKRASRVTVVTDQDQ